MKIFINKIDALEDVQNRLERDLEKKKSSINCINSKIEAKIKKLEDRAYINRVDLEKFEDAIKLKLDKNAKLITAEAEYAKKLGAKYTPKKNKKGKGNK